MAEKKTEKKEELKYFKVKARAVSGKSGKVYRAKDFVASNEFPDFEKKLKAGFLAELTAEVKKELAEKQKAKK